MRKVIFDGECSVCTNLKDFAEDKVKDDALLFIPYQSADFEQAAPTLTREQAKQALYVITENGKQLRGASAVFEVMRELPGVWGLIGKILRLPPFYWLAERCYRLFARHRHGVGRLFSD